MLEPYSIVLVIHVVASVVLVGHSFSVPATRAALAQADTQSELRRIVAFDRRLSRWNPAAALVSLVSGIYLGQVGWWAQGWFWVSVAQWVVCCYVAMRVIDPVFARLTAAAEGEGAVSPAADALRCSVLLAAAMQSDLANNLSLLYLMIVKPSTLASILVVAFTNGVLLALALWPRRERALQGAGIAS